MVRSAPMVVLHTIHVHERTIPSADKGGEARDVRERPSIQLTMAMMVITLTGP